MSRMVYGVVLLAALQGGCATAPQTRLFVDLPRYVAAGETVRVLDTSGQRTSGQLLELSATSLMLLTDAGRPEFSEPQVARIERPGAERHPVRGLAKGAGWGALAPLVPLAIYVALVDAEGNDINYRHVRRYLKWVAPIVPATAVIGAVIGLVRGSRASFGPVYDRPKP